MLFKANFFDLTLQMLKFALFLTLEIFYQFDFHNYIFFCNFALVIFADRLLRIYLIFSINNYN